MSSGNHNKSKAYLFVSILLTIALFCSHSSFAVDQDVQDRFAVAPSPEEIAKQEDYVSEITDRLDISAYVDIQMGYDNNVDLNSKRHKDGFQQLTGNVEATYSLLDNLDLKAGTDIFETIYFKYNRNNIMDVSPYAGFNLLITPDFIWRNRIKFDSFNYVNEKESTFQGLVLTTYLRNYFLEEVYQEVGFEYLKRWYPDRKTFNSDARRCDKDRIDDRFRIKYTVGAYFERAFLRVSNQISSNDSNDNFQQYYDYWLYRLRPSIMVFFTDNFYTDVSLVYRYWRYKDRRSTEDPGRRERDHTYIFNASFYYDITENITLGATYSYSENVSNDPYEDYSGSIISGGVYYSF
ncbi:hypothetical protein ACFL5E_02965 [Candidatus Omnitrophota bacterium]